MPIEGRSARTTNGTQEPPPEEPLTVALDVAQSVASRHGGEVRVGSRDDGGGDLVELRFPFPGRQA